MLSLLVTVSAHSQSLHSPDVLNALLAEISEGDKTSLSELYRRTRAAVYGFALSYLKNGQDADDITQDTFVRIWENAHRYQKRGNPLGWILTVCKNLCLMKLRERSKAIPLDEQDENNPSFSFDSPVLSVEDKQILNAALSALNDTERQILLLHAVTGLKHREIAALLELPLPTVLSKYHRALKKLKNKLEGDEPV